MQSKLILASLLFFLVSSAQAETKDELTRLHRCYAIFTSTRIPVTDPLWLAVKNGEKSGTDACMEVLVKADLGTNGKISTDSEGGPNQVGKNILESFLKFYKSQFKVSDYDGKLDSRMKNTMDITDTNEAVYQYLYSLFKNEEDFKSIMTRNFNLFALRQSEKGTLRNRSVNSANASSLFDILLYTKSGVAYGHKSTVDSCKFVVEALCETESSVDASSLTGSELSRHNMAVANCTSKKESMLTACGSVFWEGAGMFYRDPASEVGQQIPNPYDATPAFQIKPIPVQTGKLIGLKEDTRQNTTIFSSGSYVDKNMNVHHGSGILGTQAYLMGNISETSITRLNGTTKVQRHFGIGVLSDFLCRENPALRAVDVIGEVFPDSSVAFRQGISCMRCHSGMDPLAGVVRNYQMQYSHNGNRSGKVTYMGKLDLSASQMANRVLLGTYENISNYWRTAPIGRLMYRSYNGSLVNIDLENLNDLGQKITEQDDFYVCAAKRHYKFLTGIDVNLVETGEPGYLALTKKEKEYRSRVVELGMQLKESQSLKDLIRKIISSETFIHPDRGV